MAKLCEYGSILDKLTEHEFLKLASHHLIEMEGPSIGSGGCAYKGENGRCCAAAPFVMYYPEAEPGDDDSETIENLNWKAVVAAGNAHKAHADLLTDLQAIHDKEKVGNWMDSISKMIGDKFDLSVRAYFSMWMRKPVEVRQKEVDDIVEKYKGGKDVN